METQKGPSENRNLSEEIIASNDGISQEWTDKLRIFAIEEDQDGNISAVLNNTRVPATFGQILGFGEDKIGYCIAFFEPDPNNPKSPKDQKKVLDIESLPMLSRNFLTRAGRSKHEDMHFRLKKEVAENN